MKKGISLAALISTITIILILSTTVIISSNKMSNRTKRNNFATEIHTIQKSVDSYLQKNENEYPILNSIIIDLSNVSDENKKQFTDNGDKIVNNTISLFEIDYSKIGYTDLKYGNKKDGKNDMYLLSCITGRVYYAKGFVAGENIYYTLTSDLEKVLEYKTKDTVVDKGNDIISYTQESLENSKKKVTVKIPSSYVSVIVKVGDTNYSSITSGGYNLYEVIESVGTIIDITYTYNGETKSTSYIIK